MLSFDKTNTYMEALCNFRKLIESEYKEGGWLPSVRRMSNVLEISPVTCRKAIKQLVYESVAKSFPRKGIYVIPEKYRCNKIGLIIDNGRESPFIHTPFTTAQVISHAALRQYSIHMIQGSPVSNVFRCAVTHWVLGLIWIDPPKEAIPTIMSIYREKTFPLIVISLRVSTSPDDVLPGEIPVITEDLVANKNKVVDFLLSRGHRRFGYIGSKYDADVTGLTRALGVAGVDFDEKHCLGFGLLEYGSVKNMVVGQRVTALIITGGKRTTDLVFQELGELPKAQRPEVVAHKDSIWQDALGDYLDKNLIGIERMGDYGKYAETAVDMLIDHMHEPEMIHSVRMNLHTLEPLVMSELKNT